jgi:hypothetical protein
MANYVNVLWVIFLISSIAYLWVKRPPLPKGSGKNAEWIRYEVDPQRWQRYAYIVSFLCVATLGLIAFQVGVL